MKFIVLNIVLLLLLSVSSFAHDDHDHAMDYGIMIDAGSSGSRIYLYEWPNRKDKSLPLVEPTMINQVVVSNKTNNALSKFTANPSDAGESLAPLIDYVKKNLDEHYWSETPIYLKATAGMRAIPVADQNNIIADVRAYLKTTPFIFKDDYAKVIPGIDEGVFGWITVNYLLDILVKADPVTNGALDMGGASTQITFSPATTPADHVYPTTLSGVDYKLYTYSYPLGQDESRREVIRGLAADGKVDANGNVVNPCFLTGYNESYPAGTAGQLTVGSSNAAQCKEAVIKYITQPNATCTSCGMRSVYQPALHGKFYAFSGFAYTYKFFGLASNAPISNLQTAAVNYCTIDFATAKQQHPKEDVAYLANYCFTSTYLSEALLQYGFAQDSTDVNVKADVNGTEVTWALGGMIFEANLLPFGSSASIIGASYVSLMALVGLCVMLF